MTREEFDRFVTRVQEGIGRDPVALQKRVAWLAVAGYLFLGGSFAAVLCFGLIFFIPGVLWPGEAMVALVIGAIILTAGLWTQGRTLWVRLPPPEGYRLTRAEAPALYAALDELQRSLGSIPFDVLLITPAHNAGVVQRPRLGVFGWYRNYLLIGLPLMESLSAEEFRGVLAHEFAHLSRRHAQSSQWIYRLRRSWEPVFEKLSRPRAKGEVSLRPLIVKWLGWYWPRFNAHAFVLSRTHEYQADEAAARLVGCSAAGMALANSDLSGVALERKFWPELWQLTKTHPSPPAGTFRRLTKYINELPASEQQQYLEEALRSVTTNADTHPGLSDRLRSIGWAPDLDSSGRPQLPPRRPDAATVFLGGALDKIRSNVEQLWVKEFEERWQAQHAKSNALNERLDKLQATHENDTDALWDKAQVVTQIEGSDAAVPLLRQILALNPNHTGASFQLGCLLLKQGQAEGESHLERAVAHDELLLPKAANVLHVHFRLTGQAERIRELHARLDRFEKSMEMSQRERNSVTASDNFVSHGLSEAELTALRTLLAADPDITHAFLVKKELRHSSQQRFFVLNLRIRPSWHHLPNADREDQVISRISKAVQLPGRVLVIAPSGSFRAIARKIARTGDAEIFRR